MNRDKLFVANWKMHGTVAECLKRVTELKNRLQEEWRGGVVVAPPFTALYSVHIAIAETGFRLAAQNLSGEMEGAFTGEISGLFLKEVGCDFVIVGHSERRRLLGETDEIVNQKIRAALASELVPILCVGETADERKRGKMGEVLESQLKRGLREVNGREMNPFVIAYEPVWAIGTGENATAAQAGEAIGFMRNVLAKGYDAPTARGVKILYGGSVRPANAAAFVSEKEIDGLLVGGASLEARQFAEIVRGG